MFAPSTLNCTPAILTSSNADADSTTVPNVAAPSVGASSETAGGVVSGVATGLNAMTSVMKSAKGASVFVKSPAIGPAAAWIASALAPPTGLLDDCRSEKAVPA